MTVLTRRRLIVLGVFALAGAYLIAGGLTLPTSTPLEGEELNQTRLVQPADNGSYLWPYTSRERSPRERTLAINLVVHGDDDRIQRVLTEQSSVDWQLIDPNDTTAPNATRVNATDNESVPDNVTSEGEEARDKPLEIDDSVISWNDAHGSTRYSYIDARPRGGDSVWVDEAYQVHAGNYFGSRQHIRAYTVPAAEWTAIQVHQEYWDWFRLRHTVTDVRDSRTRLEQDFIGQPYVDSVSREYYGNNDGGNDGWLSQITLVPGMVLLVVGGLLTRETQHSLAQEGVRLLRWSGRNVRGFVLAGAIAALYLGVRSAAVILELAITDIDPRVFLAVLYPAVAVGIPLVAFVLSQPFGATSRFERLQRLSRLVGPPITSLAAFGFAVAGLGGAFVLDFGGMGISAIPVQLALHRVGLLVALGLIGAGGTRIDERGAGLLVVGIAGWLLGLFMPLFGYV